MTAVGDTVGPSGGPSRTRGRNRQRSLDELGPRYKWIALSNTTLGMLIATINSSIVLIALPDIFRGIGINPLSGDNTSYLLWMIMGFLVVTAVLVVAFGRLGDMFGRAKMYNLGFAIFTVSSVLLAITWFHGTTAALWLIGWRVVQGVGGAFLMANSTAILTDVFPANKRGTALGINGVAAIAGSFFGLVIGGVLAPLNWHLVFIVSVPIGLFGTIWAFLKLHDVGERKHAKMDWWGNVTFAIGLIAILVGITYGLQPYGDSPMGWGSPMVLSLIGGGIVVLIIFGVIETRVKEPLFHLQLFKIRSFWSGNLATLMSALGRGGLQFILILWLQGIWLPQHGYSFEETPLWAGIYMLPMTVGFLLASPVSGVLSDRFGPRLFAVGGMLITALSFLLLIFLPVNFNYWGFAALLFVNGIGSGIFGSPNRAAVMNSLPGNSRGVGAGMLTTFQNAAMVLSIGVFFSLIGAGLSTNLPAAMSSGLTAHGVPAAAANQVASLPPIAVLFAAFLGYNPIQQLLGPVLGNLPAGQAQFLTGRSFFPQLITEPFSDGLQVAFIFAIIACVIGAAASVLCGESRRKQRFAHAPVGAELASVSGESTGFASPAVTLVDTGLVGTVRTETGAAPGRGVVLLTDTTGRQVAKAALGADGGYVIGEVDPGAYVLTVTAGGFLPQAVGLHVGEDTSRRLVEDFVVTGMSTLAGTVRSNSGPTEGATVIAVDGEGSVLGAANADARGRFDIARLPGGTLTVTASADDYLPEAVQVPEPPDHHRYVDIVLHSVTLLSGKVCDPDGAAIENAVISVLDDAGAVVSTAATDADGRYVLTGVAPGDYTLVGALGPVGTRTVTVYSGEGTNGDIEFRTALR